MARDGEPLLDDVGTWWPEVREMLSSAVDEAGIAPADAVRRTLEDETRHWLGRYFKSLTAGTGDRSGH